MSFRWYFGLRARQIILHAAISIVAIYRNRSTADPTISGYNAPKTDGPRVTQFVGMGIIRRNETHLEIGINWANHPPKCHLEGKALPAAENKKKAAR